MTDDFEAKLKALLNEDVDTKVGAPRPAPHFDTDRVTRVAPAGPRRRAPWITPLIAAACVVAVVGGGIGASQLVADKGDKAVDRPTVTSHPRPTHTPSPMPSVPTPTSKKVVPGPHGTNHGTPSTTTSTTAPAGPAPTFTTVDGAKIAIPHGWQLTPDPPAVESDFYVRSAFCLNPKGINDNCVMGLYRLGPPQTKAATSYVRFDVDTNGFGLGDPPQYICNEGTAATDSVDEIAQDSTFGGRTADFRQWTRSCRGKVVTHELQSVVAADPGWGLYMGDVESQHIGLTFPQLLAAFEQVTSRSVLPAATGAVRYMDRGIITAASRGSSGVTVTIDRVLLTHQGQQVKIVNDYHTTYSYLVPAKLYDSAYVKVGEQVALMTNGVQATAFVRETPQQ